MKRINKDKKMKLFFIVSVIALMMLSCGGRQVNQKQINQEEFDQEPEETQPDYSEIYTGEALKAMQAYKAVLLNEAPFYDVYEEKDCKLNELECKDYITWEPIGVARFAVVDMDEDGMPEAVFDFGDVSCKSYILHYEEGKVYGFSTTYMCDLTNDGWSKQTDDRTALFFEYYQTKSVTKDGFQQELFAAQGYDRFDTGEHIYSLHGEAVSEHVFEEFLDAFGERENRAVWHDFTEENVAWVF